MKHGRSVHRTVPRLIGIDFDNTLVDYAEAFRRIGIATGLLPADYAGDRVALRAFIRASPAGDLGWQQLQARVYGPDIGLARPMEGVAEFLEAAARAGSNLAVVSHKSRYAAQDPSGVDLREAARRWLQGSGLALAADRIFFEDTRPAKLARIAGLRCSHFIDDLPEVLADPDFPEGVERILFAGGSPAEPGPYAIHPGWREIARTLFRATTPEA